MRDFNGIQKPSDDELTLVVIKHGPSNFDLTEALTCLTKQYTAQLMEEKFGFDREKILDVLVEVMNKGAHTVVFDIDKLRESGAFDK